MLITFYAIKNPFFKCGYETNLKSYTEVVDSIEVDMKN